MHLFAQFNMIMLRHSNTFSQSHKYVICSCYYSYRVLYTLCMSRKFPINNCAIARLVSVLITICQALVFVIRTSFIKLQ